jgi:hypothetical protein
VWVEGLRVVDVTDPTNPHEVGSLDSSDLQGTADRVSLTNGYAYVTALEGGLEVLDVADPSDPRLIGSYTPPDSVQAVAVTGDYAFVIGNYSTGSQRKGLFVIDVADPTRPERVGSVELSEHTSSNVVVANDYAYVALIDCYYFVCSGSLQIVDVSDSARPYLMSSLNIPGGASDVTVADDGNHSNRYIYLAAGEVGVWVADVSDPAQPRLVGLSNTPGHASGIAVVDDLVYVADDDGGFLVLHIVE